VSALARAVNNECSHCNDAMLWMDRELKDDCESGHIVFFEKNVTTDNSFNK